MLRELPTVNQVPGEPRRRWFFCHDIDLVTFEDDEGICGFQLAYDKYRGEHSIIWSVENGFKHFAVDDGEPFASAPQTPFLYANGAFQRDRVVDLFRSLASALPPTISSFVEAKLLEYDGPLLP